MEFTELAPTHPRGQPVGHHVRYNLNSTAFIENKNEAVAMAPESTVPAEPEGNAQQLPGDYSIIADHCATLGLRRSTLHVSSLTVLAVSTVFSTLPLVQY